MINIVEVLKSKIGNCENFIFREKIIKNNKITIIFDEPLTSSNKISNFIIRSLNKIEIKRYTKKNLYNSIKNNMADFKFKEIYTTEDIIKHLENGYTIIVIDKFDKYIAFETKADLARSISTPETEHAYRSSKDSFVEEYQTNLGLIKKRIKSEDFRTINFNIGKYTNTLVSILYIESIAKEEIIDKAKKSLENINISGIVSSDVLKKLIENNSSAFPTILTTERPDVVSDALLEGRIAILVDNSPYILILPTFLSDYFKTSDDTYSKNINVTFIRIIKYIAFFISIFTPAIYIAVMNYNQELLPFELIINFATQRDGVPFPVFFEAIIMMICFEILRESDLRVPSFSGSALSIVGALILGDAAVNAGIVSPIMIIIISITAISSLIFQEPDIINAIRLWRNIFMLLASFCGIIGVFFSFIILIIHLANLDSFGVNYLTPFSPVSVTGLKDSLIKVKNNKRLKVLSNNITKRKDK